MSKPTLSKTLIIWRFCGSTTATKRSMPGALCPAGELLQKPRADAAALVLVGDGERRLGRARVAQPRIGRERDDALAGLVGKGADEGAVGRPNRD